MNQPNSSVASSNSLPKNLIKSLSDRVLNCTNGIENIVKQPKIHQKWIKTTYQKGGKRNLTQNIVLIWMAKILTVETVWMVVVMHNNKS